MEALVDAHCHLQDKRIAGSLTELIQRAQANGVAGYVVCGCGEHDWDAVIHISRHTRGCAAALGLHPWYVKTRSSYWLTTLKRMLTDAEAGVGEIGLDFAVPGADRTDQESVFLEQIELARLLQRPVSVHCRRAHGRMLELLKRSGTVPGGGVMHSFSGSAEMAVEFQKLGLHISFSGSITRHRNRRGVAACRAVSSRFLLIETDTPDLVPVGANGAMNEPANLLLTCRRVAEIRNTTPGEIARLTRANALALFAWP